MAVLSPIGFFLAILTAVAAVPPAHADTAAPKIHPAAAKMHAGRIGGSAGPQLVAEEAESREALIIRPPTHPFVAAIVPAANTTCESAVVLKGRGFMYGITRGETPVLDHPHCGW